MKSRVVCRCGALIAEGDGSMPEILGICEPCFQAKYPGFKLEKPGPCPICGAAWGAGCSCPSNALAIGRGERRKAQREEPS